MIGCSKKIIIEKIIREKAFEQKKTKLACNLTLG